MGQTRQADESSKTVLQQMVETSPRLDKFSQLKREMEAGSGANMPGAKQILLDDAAGELNPAYSEEFVEALLDTFQSRNEKLYTEFMHYFWR